ncbi:MAG TPA: hypothetical protein VGO18_36390, partial [Steroidobacteraceae bacterium]|nr:hypothetical protein [Steroidobacteraceae bacterium]
MAAVENLVEWLTRQRDDVLEQIELMEAGQRTITDQRGSTSVDMTDEILVKSKRWLAELDA